MQLTITAGNEIGESKDQFKVGDTILITLTMTNTATAPVNVCLSSNLYQNLPRLTKDGQLISIMKSGKYDLSLQRRLDCCDGPTLESNKITFTVVP